MLSKPDSTRKVYKPKTPFTSIWLSTLNRRELLTAAGASAAALLLPGCGGGGAGSGKASGNGGGSFSLIPFAATPSRAAPGSMVTLSGLDVINSASIDVRFGGVPAIVYAQDSTGLQVLVPSFASAGGSTSTPPAAPVTISVQVGGKIQKSTNQFTVLPLPAAPGTTTATLVEIGSMVSFFQSFFAEGMLPTLIDPTNPGSGAVGAEPAIQGAALSAGAADFFSNTSNPNSFLSTLNSVAAQGANGAASIALLDAMLAQGPHLAVMQDFAQTIFGGISALYPDAVVSRGAAVSRAGRSAPLTYSFTQLQVDWSKVDAAQRIIYQIQLQHMLALITSSKTSNLVQAIVAVVVAAMVVFAVGPFSPLVLTIGSVALDLTIKFLSGITSCMPASISDFYVMINNVKRRSGDPAVNIPINVNTPMRLQLVAKTAGGLAFSLAGAISVALTLLEVVVPGASIAVKEVNAVVATVSEALLSVADGIWQSFYGGPPPSTWSLGDSLNFPAKNLPPIDINSNRVVTVISSSTNLLTTGVDSTRSYYLKGIHEGGNAGYHAWISKDALVTGYPTLADIAGQKWNVLGVVNIAGGAVQLGIS